METISDGLDMVDKTLDFRNFYIKSQKRGIMDEIKWLAAHQEDIPALRIHLSKFLDVNRISMLSDVAIQDLATIRGNYLYSQLLRLGNRVDTLPLKVIVQELKYMGM